MFCFSPLADFFIIFNYLSFNLIDIKMFNQSSTMSHIKCKCNLNPKWCCTSLHIINMTFLLPFLHDLYFILFLLAACYFMKLWSILNCKNEDGQIGWINYFTDGTCRIADINKLNVCWPNVDVVILILVVDLSKRK